MSPITTHVLDTAAGKPAAGIAVALARLSSSGQWIQLATGTTNADGRVAELIEPELFEPGVYRLLFTTGYYFAARGQRGFYPIVPIIFEVSDRDSHYHVPLLLSPYGYSTYRGS